MKRETYPKILSFVINFYIFLLILFIIGIINNPDWEGFSYLLGLMVFLFVLHYLRELEKDVTGILATLTVLARKLNLKPEEMEEEIRKFYLEYLFQETQSKTKPSKENKQ